VKTEKEIREMLKIMEIFIRPKFEECTCQECKRNNGFKNALEWVLK